MVAIPGLYWRTRDWVGFENLSTMFYDDPKLVHDMMEHNTVFIIDVLKRGICDGMIDCVTLNEDMAYKHASMISPAMFKEFMLPRYKRIIRELKSCGLPVFLVDSDGHISELLPFWIEAGADGCWPIEIAADNDPVEYRRRFGNSISMWGGIDKREIRTKDRVYREIMKKATWLIEQGGISSNARSWCSARRAAARVSIYVRAYQGDCRREETARTSGAAAYRAATWSDRAIVVFRYGIRSRRRRILTAYDPLDYPRALSAHSE